MGYTHVIVVYFLFDVDFIDKLFLLDINVATQTHGQ